MFVSLPAFADQDNYSQPYGPDEAVYHDRDFYIPYMPGAKDCYGAYNSYPIRQRITYQKLTGHWIIR